MEELPRIKTPWKQQWRRIRYQVVPVAGLAVCLVAIAALWNRQVSTAQGVGEVRAPDKDAVAERDGHLAYMPLRLYDSVDVGQLVARLDDGPTRRALQQMEEDLARLDRDLPSTGPADSKQAEVFALVVQLERNRLKALQARTRSALARLQANLLQEVLAPPAATDDTDADLDDLDDALSDGPAPATRPGDDPRDAELLGFLRQIDAARLKLKDLPALPADVENRFAAYRAALAAQEARLPVLYAQIDTLNIRSPLQGRVTAIFRRDGQYVRAGEPIVTITANVGDCILAYIRQDQRANPSPSMTVIVRSRRAVSESGTGIVERVGPRLEYVPTHQLRDPKVPEWGLPIIITMPPNLTLRPGELVDVRFTSGN